MGPGHSYCAVSVLLVLLFATFGQVSSQSCADSCTTFTRIAYDLVILDSPEKRENVSSTLEWCAAACYADGVNCAGYSYEFLSTGNVCIRGKWLVFDPLGGVSSSMISYIDTTRATATGSSGCPAGMKFCVTDQTCYLTESNRYIHSTAVNERCNTVATGNKGGWLVTIDSQEMQDFVIAFATSFPDCVPGTLGYWWVASVLQSGQYVATQLDQTLPWEPITWTNWYTGEPSNDPAKPWVRMAIANDYQWETSISDTRGCYLCQYKP